MGSNPRRDPDSGAPVDTWNRPKKTFTKSVKCSFTSGAPHWKPEHDVGLIAVRGFPIFSSAADGKHLRTCHNVTIYHSSFKYFIYCVKK